MWPQVGPSSAGEQAGGKEGPPPLLGVEPKALRGDDEVGPFLHGFARLATAACMHMSTANTSSLGMHNWVLHVPGIDEPASAYLACR